MQRIDHSSEVEENIAEALESKHFQHDL